jgi:hypothetical protein
MKQHQTHLFFSHIFSTTEKTIPAAEKTLLINSNSSWNAIVTNNNAKKKIMEF